MNRPPAQFPDDATRWRAVIARDHAADGAFVFAVRTTGIYCRPGCGARTPRRENVAFHATAADAQAAGFRACRRCDPDGAGPAGRDAQIVAAACARIEAADTPPTLSVLAEAAGLSPHHFHRLFRRVTGLTPRGFAAARRAEAARRALPRAASVTDAIYDAGFEAPSRFYAASGAMLGMRPARYRARGRGETIRFAIGRCSLGDILVAATDTGVCAILLGDDPAALLRDLQDRFADAELVGGDAGFDATVAAAVALVDYGADAAPALPLDIRGTAFQQRVWQALASVGPGETIGYAELAARIGAPNAARAVAQACAANALAVAIPCHRVVRGDGALSGYRWGIERKRDLLARESARR